MSSADRKASGGVVDPAAQKGVRMTPGEAQLLFWAILALGTGSLLLGKSLLSRRHHADRSAAAVSVPAGRLPPLDPAPAPKKAPAPTQPAGEEYSIDLSAPAEPAAPAKRPRRDSYHESAPAVKGRDPYHEAPAKPAGKSKGDGQEYEVSLE